MRFTENTQAKKGRERPPDDREVSQNNIGCVLREQYVLAGAEIGYFSFKKHRKKRLPGHLTSRVP